MDSGYRFENAGMVITCISFHSIGNRNVGLFQRENDGMYITARNTSKDKDISAVRCGLWFVRLCACFRCWAVLEWKRSSLTFSVVC